MRNSLYRRKFRSLLLNTFSRLRFFITRKSGSGWTEFARMNVVPEYVMVDKAKKQVIGAVKYEGITYLTVTVDIARNETRVAGSLKRIKNVIKPFNQRHYIEMIEQEAEFFMCDK